jgi:thiamine biosynthesis lipoprotein
MMTAAQPISLEKVRARSLPKAQIRVAGSFFQLSFTAMSTICRVSFTCDDARLAREFQQEVLNWIASFESQYSRFIPDSVIGRINAAAGLHWVEVDAETERLLDLCEEMVSLTRGIFDPTALPLIQLWNWKATPPVMPKAEAVAEKLELVGWRKVERRDGGVFLPQKGMCLDLGGIGKEYAVDCIMERALERGINDVLVDFGQDLRAHGKPPERSAWYIGLENPKIPGNCWTGLAVNNHAIATSGDYVRHFMSGGRCYGHIIDPRNGYPANSGCLSVSVVAPNCTLAGILSTTSFILGPKEGLDLIGMCPVAEGAIITENSCFQTRNFNSFMVK